MNLKAFGKTLVSFTLILTMLMSSALAYEELAKGSKGDAVVALQERLNELGYSVGTADGDYGNKTQNAIARFQICNGISITGIADEETQTVLFGHNAIEHRYGTNKNDIINEISNQFGEPITDITRTGYDGDDIAFVNDDGLDTLLVFIGSQGYFWMKDITYDDFSFIKSVLYQYSDVFDYYEYVNELTNEVTGYKRSGSKSEWNGSSYAREPYKENEIADFLMLIDSEVIVKQDTEDIATENNMPAPTATPAPTPKPTTKPVTIKPKYSKADCQNIAINTLKGKLKNPASLQVHSVSIDGKEGDITFGFEIDFSAMNSMGGYSRQKFFCIVNANTGATSMVTII